MGLETLFLISSFVTLGVLSLGDPPPLINTDCCYKKKHGDKIYTQIAGDTSKYSTCIKDCVYEQAQSPGLEFCFPYNCKKEVIECCQEPERKLGHTNMAASINAKSGLTDRVAFKLDEDNYLECTIEEKIGLSGDVLKLENTECKEIEGIPEGLFLSIDDGGEFAYTVEYENNLEFHMSEYFIACVRDCTESECSLRCVSYLGQYNVVYVEDSFEDIDEQDKCQEKCNNTTDCTFWTFSAMRGHDDQDDHNVHEDHDDHDHHTRVKRNHQGPPECGIRTYTPFAAISIKKPIRNPTTQQIEFVDDDRQRTGLKGFEVFYKAQVFVQLAFRTSSPSECAKAAFSDYPKWKFWTFSFADSTCVFASYTPARAIQVLPPTPYGLIGVVSGIVDPWLLANWENVTEFPWSRPATRP